MAGMSRDEKIRQVQTGALRHYGRKYAFWIVFGPTIAKGVGLAALIAAAYWGWAVIPHAVLGAVALSVAGAATLAALIPKLPSLGVRRRLVARASGVSAPQLRMGWALGLLVVAGVGMGWLALWSPFA